MPPRRIGGPSVYPRQPHGLWREVSHFGYPKAFSAQVVAILATMAFSGIMSYIIAKGIDKTIGLRATEQEELEGLDITLHEERSYVLSETA